jgi:hypothetical protein
VWNVCAAHNVLVVVIQNAMPIERGFGSDVVIALPQAMAPSSNSSSKARHSRLKGAQEARKRRSTGSSLRNSGRVGGAQTIQRLSGDVAPYNDKAYLVSDPFEGKVYMVAGERHNEEEAIPTTDFYCLDIASKKWKNLTVGFYASFSSKFHKIFYRIV